MIRIPGLSSARVSEEIPMPDIGQLLLEPFFFDTDIHSAYENGSEFQRKLIDSIPDLGAYGHNVISVMCEVRLLGPDFRACTVPDEDDVQEWHIDDESGIDGDSQYNWAHPSDRVHLYTNQTSAMTEFLKDDLILTDLNPEDFTFNEFMGQFKRFFKNEQPKTEKMPPNRIVTFENHLHRANNPKNYEFRYMFRITETNRKRESGEYNEEDNNSVYVIDFDGQESVNVHREDNKVTIHVPGSGLEKPQPKQWTRPSTDNQTNTTEDEEESKVSTSSPDAFFQQTKTNHEEDEDPYVIEDENFNNPIPEPTKYSQAENVEASSPNKFFGGVSDNSIPNNPKEPFKTMNVSFLTWNTDKIAGATELVKSAPKDVVGVICKGIYSDEVANENLLTFFKKMPKTVELEDENGERIKSSFKYDFYDYDEKIGYFAGAFIAFSPLVRKSLKPGHSYKVIVNEQAEYRYIIPEDLRVTIPEDFTP